MKRISLLLAMVAVWAAPGLRAQDAATEERLNKLSGRIEDLVAGQEVLKRQVAELARDLQSLREQSSQPKVNYARAEDFNSLAEKIKEVDRKRLEDAEKVRTELLKLRDVLRAASAPPKKAATPTRSPKDTATTAPVSDKGYEYVVQSGDTLDAIVAAYREQNIKVTVNQIVAANPGLVPERMRVGQKIFIPAP